MTCANGLTNKIFVDTLILMKIKNCYLLLIAVLFISCAGIPSKGDIYLNLTAPSANIFHIVPENESAKNQWGFLGIAAGLDYYYSENQFINLGGGGIIDFPVPVPISLSPISEGETERFYSIFVGLSNNHRIGRFTIGYGPSYVRNTWRYVNYDTDESIKKTHDAFGLIVPVYFRITEFFNIGILYLPTFFRPNMTDKLIYEHSASIDLKLKIPVNKKRNL
jgi:hypothetical protein